MRANQASTSTEFNTSPRRVSMPCETGDSLSDVCGMYTSCYDLARKAVNFECSGARGMSWETMQSLLDAINNVLWHDYVLYIVLGVGILFTIWSGFSQYHALTHGVSVIRGKYDDKHDPGAINHFQALSAALSGTVGLGNIGGVALAVALGGPGAVFWMWMVGLVGMALKTTEVTLAMLYRDTSDPDNPHGGAMFVADQGFAKMGLAPLGKLVGGIFCITLLISAFTGGNMFQAWNVGVITETYFPVPQQFVGIVLTVLVGLVVLGGIKRIGAVAGALVPFMCAIYLLAAVYVIVLRIDQVPAMLRLVVESAFRPIDASQAFLGGTAGYAFLWGMKRALFSNEAGQGSSPIAHCAAKTDEPVREGVVAGLEPFIDTIVVCTLTTLVVLLSGSWNRGPEALFPEQPAVVNADQVELNDGSLLVGRLIGQTDESLELVLSSPGIGEEPIQTVARADVRTISKIPDQWVLDTPAIPVKTTDAVAINGHWRNRDTVFALIRGELDESTGRDLHKLTGTIRASGDALQIGWRTHGRETAPALVPETDGRIGLYNDFVGAALTGHAFDRVTPGLGMWVVTVACWLFALSTIISWCYYGEQGVVYLFGQRGVVAYRVIYCLLVMVSCAGFIQTDQELDAISALGTGVMLFANIPIMLIFGAHSMRAYHDYFRRLKAGQMTPHAAPPITEVMEGKDVE
jgi:AGCS family alanine or glycine:cation symporter